MSIACFFFPLAHVWFDVLCHITNIENMLEMLLPKEPISAIQTADKSMVNPTCTSSSGKNDVSFFGVSMYALNVMLAIMVHHRSCDVFVKLLSSSCSASHTRNLLRSINIYQPPILLPKPFPRQLRSCICWLAERYLVLGYAFQDVCCLLLRLLGY